MGIALESESSDAQASQPVDKCYLWPCNQITWHWWLRLQTQWRIGMGGREGLDYGAVIAYLRHVAGMTKKQLRQSMSELQAMERAALGVWAKKRD